MNWRAEKMVLGGAVQWITRFKMRSMKFSQN